MRTRLWAPSFVGSSPVSVVGDTGGLSNWILMNVIYSRLNLKYYLTPRGHLGLKRGVSCPSLPPSLMLPLCEFRFLESLGGYPPLLEGTPLQTTAFMQCPREILELAARRESTTTLLLHLSP